MLAELNRAVFLKENDKGITPIAEAVLRGRVGRFIKFKEYFEQTNQNDKPLLKLAAEAAGVSYSQLSKALEKGKEIKLPKKEVKF